MDEKIIEQKTEKKRVSYSQFKNWYECRHRWYLDHVKKLRIFEDNINTCFGTAIHEVLQFYIETLYKDGEVVAGSHNLDGKFVDRFKKEIEDKKVISDPTLITEFVADGITIIKEFIKSRPKYFPIKKYEFISVEDEVQQALKHNVDFIGYIDLVLKDKLSGRYKIIDIKTSTSGWNHYVLDSKIKQYQLLLYKAFYSKKYNIPINQIDIEFFIVKRKLYENVSYPQNYIQLFCPNSNKAALTEAVTTFNQFITECFDATGGYIEAPEVYLKNPGKSKKNCKYCPHKKTNCDTKSDLEKEDEE